jgi:hypothetical protein
MWGTGHGVWGVRCGAHLHAVDGEEVCGLGVAFVVHQCDARGAVGVVLDASYDAGDVTQFALVMGIQLGFMV